MAEDTERPDEPIERPDEPTEGPDEPTEGETPAEPEAEGLDAAAEDLADAQEATDEVIAASDETTQATEAPSEAPAETPEATAERPAEATEPPTPPPAEDDLVEETPRQKPEIPGAHLEVDIVPEGSDPLGREAAEGGLEDIEVPTQEPPTTEADVATEPEPEPETEAAPRAVIDLAADARYRATGKRKTAVARVILRPGNGRYEVNARPLEDHFPRPTLQRNIRQPLETVGYEARMDVVATLHGGGVSAQADALRHGISRALIEADPNLRGELKRRGFLTRDPRVKERKKAGLKKARKRPQFSKR